MAYSKGARGPRRYQQAPRPSFEHPPVERLRKAGAPSYVVDEVYRRWSSLSVEERRESATMIETATDEELRQGIAAMEIVAVAGDGVDDELAQEAAELLLAGVPDGTVAEVEKWADTQPKALAALAAEWRRVAPDRRKTLIETLRRRAS